MIAEHLTIDEEADIKEMFEELDVQTKGELTFDELQEALHKQGHDPPDSDARMIMDAASVLIYFHYYHTISFSYCSHKYKNLIMSLSGLGARR